MIWFTRITWVMNSLASIHLHLRPHQQIIEILHNVFCTDCLLLYFQSYSSCFCTVFLHLTPGSNTHAHRLVLFIIRADQELQQKSRLTHWYSDPLQSRWSNDTWPCRRHWKCAQLFVCERTDKRGALLYMLRANLLSLSCLEQQND